MLKLFGRMIPAAVRGFSQKPLHPGEPVSSAFRVWPHDIDLNRHLNNGRYLQLIDVNRAEYLLRTGIARTIFDKRWKPVLGSTTIQFRRELRLWEQAVATTRLLGWDGRWVYLEHSVHTRSGRPVAIAMARAGFRKNGSWVPIDVLRDALPHHLPEMTLPAQVLAWKTLEETLVCRIGARDDVVRSAAFTETSNRDFAVGTAAE